MLLTKPQPVLCADISKFNFVLFGLFFFLLNLHSGSLSAQCAWSDNQFSTSPAPTLQGEPSVLTSCIYPTEYRTVTGLVAGTVYRFETCGDDAFDTQISIFAEGGGPSLAFNDDFCGLQSSVDFIPSVSGNYDVQINGPDCAFNPFTCMTLTATLISVTPANDLPCNAATLSADGTIGVFSNQNATSDLGEVGPPAGSGASSCQSQDGWCSFELNVDNSIWFSFTAPSSGNVTISTCNEGTTVDTQIALYEVDNCAEYGSFALLGANDDRNNCLQNLASSLTSCVVPGNIYFLQIDGYSGSEGNIAISITEEDGADCIDCPLLGDVGDACDDGDPDTNFDQVNSDCECTGALPCIGGFEWVGAFLTGFNEVIQISTSNLIGDYGEIENAEIGQDYTFIATANTGEAPVFITVRSETFDGPVLGAGFSPLTVTSDIDGSIFPSYTSDEFCSTTSIGSFTSSVQCISCPVFCTDLGLAEGSPCDDEDPDTNFDQITSECECAGILPCLGTFEWEGTTMFGSNTILEISNDNLIGDYSEVLNVVSGDEYTFVSTDNSGTDPIYITVRSGTFDGPVLGAGFSPLTVTSDIDGALYPTYSANEFCDFTGIGEFTSTVQCISCPVFCQGLGLLEGEPCDDEDPNTINDIVTEDCECIGDLIPENDLCANAIGIPVNLPGECPDNATAGTTTGSSNEGGIGGACEVNNPDVFYSFNSGGFSQILINGAADSGVDLVISVFDELCGGNQILCSLGATQNPLAVNPNTDYTIRLGSNLDFGTTGGFTICLEGVYDCPTLSANIGTSCNDGNPNTQNDTVTPDCNCEGTITFDCPLISADIGDPCNDGNPNTENDTVSPDCECVGTPIAPANDLCENAETLSVQLPGDCSGNETVGTTLNANGTALLECEPDQPDVFYTFNAGTYTNVVVNVSAITADDLVTNFYDDCSGTNPQGCVIELDHSTLLAVEPGQDYIIRVHSFGAVTTGSFSICVEGAPDCPELDANIGDSCNDGNPNTENDTVTPDCGCEGTSIFDCPLLSADIGDPCNDGNPGTENDIVNASCNCVGTPIPNATASLLTLDCGAQVIQISGAISGGTGGGTATSSTRTIYAFAPDAGGGIATYTGSTWPYVLIATGIDIDPGISASLTVSGTGQLLVDGWPAYQFVNDNNASQTNGTFGPWSYFESNGDLSQDACATSAANLTGTVENWDNSCADRLVSVDLYEPGSIILEASFVAVVGSDGSFQIEDVIAGTYDVFVKIDGYLRDGFGSITLNEGANSLNIPNARLGDLNNNNVVNFFDGSAFNNFLSPLPYDPFADFNCDGVVNFFDASSLNQSFGDSGDNPPLIGL